MKTYAGIGSRRTPPDVLNLMTELAERLARDGWTLRSGHAPGADQAFELGAEESAEVYLPWPSFEREVETRASVIVSRPPFEAYTLAGEFHPHWLWLKRGARVLHARNVGQILGQSYLPEERSRFVVCWTPDGSLDGRGEDSGGTGQALRIAKAYDVPVFNLAREEHHLRVLGWLS